MHKADTLMEAALMKAACTRCTPEEHEGWLVKWRAHIQRELELHQECTRELRETLRND